VESAQIAFTAGTRLVAVIAAATSLGIAALVVATLRRVRTPEDETS
jgi:hypothetical protein